MPIRTESFLTREGPLTPGDASAAIIVLEDGRYVMQLRDQIPGIFYPGHWGLFGGGIELGETPEKALTRELREELDLEIDRVSYFTSLIFDFAPHGAGTINRFYFEVPISLRQLNSAQLGEGAAVKAFVGAELLLDERVTPYDAFAVWMHMTRR